MVYISLGNIFKKQKLQPIDIQFVGALSGTSGT